MSESASRRACLCEPGPALCGLRTGQTLRCFSSCLAAYWKLRTLWILQPCPSMPQPRHFCPAQVFLHSWGTPILVSTLEIFPFPFSHLLASDVLTSASAERSAGHISRLLKALTAVLKRKYRRLFWVFPGMATATAILFLSSSSSTPVLSLAWSSSRVFSGLCSLVILKAFCYDVFS